MFLGGLLVSRLPRCLLKVWSCKWFGVRVHHFPDEGACLLFAMVLRCVANGFPMSMFLGVLLAESGIARQHAG